MKSDYDIIIIGGGMVGMALACALAPTKRIALVDAAPLIKKDDSRLIALNYNSYCLFKNLDAWENLAPHAADIQALHVSHRGHFGVTRLQGSECGLPVLGYVVPAQHIEAALNTALAARSNVTLYRPAVLNNFSTHTNGICVNITDNAAEITLNAALLIGADGTHSSVRRMAGINTETTDYQQTAIVTVTQLQRSHANTAYERFHGNGAIAMLPLKDNFAATIWTEANDKIKMLLALSEQDFLQTLQKEFGYRLGRFLAVGERHTYPLQLQTARQDFSGNVILIGNAAHTLHPVAAQGLNLALAEIAMLTQVIAEEDPSWKNYRVWQQQQFTNSLHLSHHLLQLFAQDFAPVAWARQTGMLTLSLCPPLKRRFALKALGRHSALPGLLLDASLE
jgi:2-octaprenyl-6-methoxyphenol hydroxylase